MKDGLLSDFCGSVQGRMKRYGFDWTTLIDSLLPMLIEALQNCFNKSSDLEAFAAGKRGPLQMAGLRNRCRRIVQEQGVRGVFRVGPAASDLQQAIMAELDDRAGKASGDVWQQALDEAASVG
jgi:hypothetical protein